MVGQILSHYVLSAKLVDGGMGLYIAPKSSSSTKAAPTAESPLLEPRRILQNGRSPTRMCHRSVGFPVKRINLVGADFARGKQRVVQTCPKPALPADLELLDRGDLLQFSVAHSEAPPSPV